MCIRLEDCNINYEGIKQRYKFGMLPDIYFVETQTGFAFSIQLL